MGNVLNRGTLFDPESVKDLVVKVNGHSSLAVLSKQEGIPFNGQKEFIFTMDSEIDVVGESGKKSHGGVTIEPRVIMPIKFEYGARVSEEFMYATAKEKVDFLKAFNDGFAKKVARGIDLAAFHGVNPRTGLASTVIGANHFDAAVTNTVTGALTDANGLIEDAVGMTGENDVTGMALSPTLRTALAKQKDDLGNPMFPELKWGNAPDSINGLPVSVNKTVSDMSTDAHAYIGDFQSGFKWGYSKQIPLKVIQYGDPDNTGVDLAGSNQVYLRAEIFLGWAVFDADSFARIVEGE